MSEQSQVSDLLAALDLAVLEPTSEEGVFRLVTNPPAWFSKLVDKSPEDSSKLDLTSRMPFLENYLIDADLFWRNPDGAIEGSGSWVERTDDGEIYLEAQAMAVGPQRILIIRNLGSSYVERAKLLQKARESSLSQQFLSREIQEKEILLHCIIHDLAGPLTGIKGVFSLLEHESLTESARRRLSIGHEATRQLEKLVRSTLEVFAAESDIVHGRNADPDSAPDLADCVRNVVHSLASAASLKEIDLSVKPPFRKSVNWQVVGEQTRLERVLYNLLDNALRHTPQRGTVTVTAEKKDQMIELRVRDSGAGVPEEEVPQLFQRFYQGAGGGKAGLGLYFCRIVVERWGGSIGYSAWPSGGAVFWFRLPCPGFPSQDEALSL